MGFGRFRFGRSFGNVNGRMFRGARPLVQYLLNLYRGAAAAYSLRSLSRAWRKEPVVEVRRASDDTTKNFTATDIGDGTMANWVNATVALPLDTASGAAAAYSLRNLSTSYSGNVVKVRRSSDDAERSFTAAEVADGTLVDWMGGLGTPRNFTSDKYETFTNVSTHGFTCTNTSGIAYAGWDLVSGVAGDVVSVSFDLDIISGSPKLALRPTYNTGTISSNETEYTESGSYTLDITATDNFSFLSVSEGDIPSEFTVSNLKITNDSGHVTTWYDQSGNNNHAEQTTPDSQPKVVDAGVLVADGLKFDGAEWVDIDLGSTSSQPISLFITHQSDTIDGSKNELFDANNSLDNRILLDQSGSNYRLFAGSSQNTGLAVTANEKAIISAFYNGALSYASKNGVESAQFDVGSNGLYQYNYLGRSQTRYYEGIISEIIIYDSDQSDNRKAIESNMADHYGDIDLPVGFDSGNNEVDGYVSTWYDQSGNGNHAVQTTATSQPKIVEGGVLVADGLKFDGVDDVLYTSAYVVEMSQNAASVFAISSSSLGEYSVVLSEADLSNSSQFILGGEDGGVTNNSVIWVNGQKAGTNTTGKVLIGFDWDQSEVRAYKDGALSGTIVSPTINPEYGNATAIGGKVWGGAFGQLNGAIQEIIIYNSDQSAKRTDIEGNINDYYEIFADETYRRPDGSAIFRPDGTSVYERP